MSNPKLDSCHNHTEHPVAGCRACALSHPSSLGSGGRWLKKIGHDAEPTAEEVEAMLTLVRGGWLKLELT